MDSTFRKGKEMKIDDYSSLESYAKGLFDGYMGQGMKPEQTTLEDYLKGYNRAIFALQTEKGKKND
jgi:hypothetical protein